MAEIDLDAAHAQRVRPVESDDGCDRLGSRPGHGRQAGSGMLLGDHGDARPQELGVVARVMRVVVGDDEDTGRQVRQLGDLAHLRHQRPVGARLRAGVEHAVVDHRRGARLGDWVTGSVCR